MERLPETPWAQQARRATLKERQTLWKLEWLLEHCRDEAKRMRYQRLHKKVQRAEIKKYLHVYAYVKRQEKNVVDLTTPKPRVTPHKKMRFPKFPKEAYDDLGLKERDLGERKGDILPYLARDGGAVVVLWANWFFVLPA
mgnify:CR=1 FL=1